MIRKVLYFHYQRSERDGSFVHTMEFEAAFKKLCAEKGIVFKVFSPELVAHTGDQPLGLFSKLKRRLARFYLRDFRTALLQVFSFYKELAILREEKPDVVLTRYNHANATLAILWACRKQGIPVVIEMNSPNRDSDQGLYQRFPFFIKLFSARTALSLADGLFAVSDEISEPLRQEAKPGQPVITIPNGVDIDRFDPSLSPLLVRQRLGIPKERVVFGFVGSFAPWHGVDLLVDAFSMLLNEGLPVHLLLVGQTNPLWQAQIDRLKSPEFSPYVSLAGFVTPSEIPNYLAAMDITTLPNQADYCSPLKLFEYMAMSRPTVSVNTKPVAMTMADGKEGLLFPAGDVSALAEHMRDLVVHPDKRQALGAAARVRMEQEFTWRHNAERVFALLEEAYSKTS
ncbi:MAG: glycosyltransferase family 4 protein [Betaproteobacteria bacterium]